MKRSRRLTRRERQAVTGPGPAGTPRPAPSTNLPSTAAIDPKLSPGTHLHCVACGKHLDTVGEARARGGAGLASPLWVQIRCGHGSAFYACMECVLPAKQLLDEHDRTGGPVRAAAPFH